MTDQTPEAGWYDDPDDGHDGEVRWWDGNQWHDAWIPAGQQPPTEPPAPAPTEPPVPAKSSNSGCLIAIGIVLLLAIIGGALGGDDDGDSGGGGSGRDEPTNIGAILICEEFVRDRLRSPGTADFMNTIDVDPRRSGDTFTVDAFVDSENGFGALVRTDYTCVVEYQGDDRWRLQDLDMQQR